MKVEGDPVGDFQLCSSESPHRGAVILSLGCGRRHNADAQAMQRVSSEPAREELRGVATASLQVAKLIRYGSWLIKMLKV